jgi:hypothetical protein
MNVTGAPVQVVPVEGFIDGVTVMVAVAGVDPALIAVNEGRSPVPPAARPMDGLLLAHVKIVPDTDPLKVTGVVAVPLQADWLEMALTDGVGYTVIVKVVVDPVQRTPP